MKLTPTKHLFARFVEELLRRSDKIRCLVSSTFPNIILDEFQDTNDEQWSIVQHLGKNSTLIVLADPEQRIYDFIGVDPNRVNHLRSALQPQEFDLGKTNYRSPSTELAEFGKDVLAAQLRSSYVGLSVITFPSNQNQAFAALKGQVLQARKRLVERKLEDWSLAVLVPTKKMMRQVSDSLHSVQPSMPAIKHHAFIDMEGAILSAELLAFMLQPQFLDEVQQFVELICNFFLGKGGNTPTKKDIAESQKLLIEFKKAVLCKNTGKEIPKNSIILPTLNCFTECIALQLSGDPDHDWLAVRGLLDNSGCSRLMQIAIEARNIRLLDRGTQLRESLAEEWRSFGDYRNALAIVRQAFVREHFSTSSKPEKGIVVMNMVITHSEDIHCKWRWGIGTYEHL